MNSAVHPSNPFAVQTPEGISAKDVVSLFVDEFTDYHQVPKLGHTFLVGPRGSGKSMILRFLQPDVQVLSRNCHLDQLDFISVYIPIKKTELSITEVLGLKDKHGDIILNEHLMVLNFALKTVEALQRLPIEDNSDLGSQMLEAFYKPFIEILENFGYNEAQSFEQGKHLVSDVLNQTHSVLGKLYIQAMGYIKKIPFSKEISNFDGPILGYIDFLYPILRGISNIAFLPKGNVFLLIDDADHLTEVQTKILNSWVSYRTTADVSLKIATQRNYKSYRTVSGMRIEKPHDYSEVNISDIYTSNRKKYRDRVAKIVEKRLSLYGIEATSDAFFPRDEKQEEQITQIGRELTKKWGAGEGRGYRASDDVQRYARPDYIKNLGGTAKSRSTYSYAGFDQLVHVSSGVIRYFLEPASLMYGAQQARNGQDPVRMILPSIQDDIIRAQANEMFFGEFSKLENEETEQEAKTKIQKLRNLIESLGATFQSILLSDAAERRVFSIAFSDAADEEVRSVLGLGVELGYFHQASIGRKEGNGRTELYIMSRRLAPMFTLDPTSFAGYKFVTNEFMRQAMLSPKKLMTKIRSTGVDQLIDPVQPSLFSE